MYYVLYIVHYILIIYHILYINLSKRADPVENGMVGEMEMAREARNSFNSVSIPPLSIGFLWAIKYSLEITNLRKFSVNDFLHVANKY